MRKEATRAGRPLTVALAAASMAASGGLVVFIMRSEPIPGVVNEPPPAAAALPEVVTGPFHENLNATAWMQTAAEYRAAVLQAYALAELRLLEGLADPTWSAALEQIQAGGFEQLPPAVVLDLDETVLDNSAYQARLVIDGAEFLSDSWNDWVREARAGLLPGVERFVAAAQARGVAVFWITNRDAIVEAATRANLARLGLPLSDTPDNLLCSGEQPGWSSDKGSRRQHVAASHRIVLQIGDNLGDFMSGVLVDRFARQQMVDAWASYWGSRWIMLPNPQYGSWDGALIGYRYGMPWAEKRALKVAALDPQREETQ